MKDATLKKPKQTVTYHRLLGEIKFLKEAKKKGHRWTRGANCPHGITPRAILGSLISIDGVLAGLKKAAGVTLILLCFLLAGCETVINTPQGKVISVTERGLGFHVKMNSETTGTPDVTFGFWSSAVVLLPTSTNHLNAPNFDNTFTFDQTGALQLGIGEHITSGAYAPYVAVGTNVVVATNTVTK